MFVSPNRFMRPEARSFPSMTVTGVGLVGLTAEIRAQKYVGLFLYFPYGQTEHDVR